MKNWSVINFKKCSKAFTLFEMAMVLLIMGTLIGGIIQGNKIISRAQLAGARSLTLSSPVSTTKNLALWYETTLENSFKTTEEIDGTALSAWYDISQQLSTRTNATQSTSAAKPLFTENAFSNGIPSVRFDGSDDYLQLPDVNFLVGKSYTIFLVEQKRVAFASQTFIFNAGPATTGAATLIGWHSDTSFGIDKYSDYTGLTDSALAHSNPVTRIHTIQNNTAVGTKYWLNGGIAADASGSSKTVLTSSNAPYLAKYVGSYYKGDLGELIIFTRVLTTEERQAIESYLGQKYKITIS